MVTAPAGIEPHWRPHNLRHWSATEAIASGQDQGYCSGERLIRGENYALVVTTDITQIDSEILANRVAILATLGPDGRPQQTPIWFIVEDDKIKMSVSQSRQKYKNLAADGRGTVLIFHPDSELYYVEIRGDIEVTDDLDFAFADRLGPTKYATDMRSFDGPNARWAMLSLTPTKINVIDVRGAADQALAEFPGDGLDR
jgi:PPOX class probable F420-dependent enzyme